MIHDSSTDSMGADTLERARHIASLFDLPRFADICDFLGKGNINRQTYLIKAGPAACRTEFLLQLLNPDVFTRPRVVMDAMTACIQAQQKALSEKALPGHEEWETIRLVPTKEGNPYLEIAEGGGLRCWRMMERIGHAYSCRSLREISDPGRRLRIAEEAGRGLALFGILTAGVDADKFGCSLPGYRDTRLYYDQLASVLEGHRTFTEASAYLPSDPIVRQSTARHFLIHIGPAEYRRRREDPQLRRCIALALEEKPFALTLNEGLTAGNLKKVVIHGDTKLDNFLFSASTGRVKALVDLDTLMPHTWLTDWGDMVRSLVNIAGERETDLKRIHIDLEVFKAMARGFLGTARRPPVQEVRLMADAPQIMALELGVRFLADYLRGDSYFRLGPADPLDLNKTRALVQFCVFEHLRRNAVSLTRCIDEIGYLRT